MQSFERVARLSTTSSLHERDALSLVFHHADVLVPDCWLLLDECRKQALARFIVKNQDFRAHLSLQPGVPSAEVASLTDDNGADAELPDQACIRSQVSAGVKAYPCDAARIRGHGAPLQYQHGESVVTITQSR
jgi:hypothetical protein